MLYTSLIAGYSRGVLGREDALALLAWGCRAAARRFGPRAGASLGAVGKGALGDAEGALLQAAQRHREAHAVAVELEHRPVDVERVVAVLDLVGAGPHLHSGHIMLVDVQLFVKVLNSASHGAGYVAIAVRRQEPPYEQAALRRVRA